MVRLSNSRKSIGQVFSTRKLDFYKILMEINYPLVAQITKAQKGGRVTLRNLRYLETGLNQKRAILKQTSKNLINFGTVNQRERELLIFQRLSKRNSSKLLPTRLRN
jgi:hypothetical protein